MTTPTVTSSTDSQMHNNIMTAALRKCILNGPYKPITVLVQAVAATDDSLAIPEHTIVETPMNMSPPEWSRFVTIVKQQHKLDEVSYHKLFDILKQYQKEVNELRAERLATNANPLALVATAEANQDPYYQTSKKPKRVKDFTYHKEKMLLWKQTEKGVPLQAEQYDWLADTDEEIDKQELEAHYSYMAKIRSNTCLVETDDGNVFLDSSVMCDDDIHNDQNDVESDDERVALANLKLDTEFEKYKAFNDRTVDYDKLERKLNETLGQLAQKDIKIKEGQLAQKDIKIKEGLKTKAYEILVVKKKDDELIKQSLLTKSHYEGLVKQKTKVIADLKLKEEHDIDKMLSMEKQLKFLNEIV
nr:hypothetical protein [Tanacetum cinerariifolium]